MRGRDSHRGLARWLPLYPSWSRLTVNACAISVLLRVIVAMAWPPASLIDVGVMLNVRVSKIQHIDRLAATDISGRTGKIVTD